MLAIAPDQSVRYRLGFRVRVERRVMIWVRVRVGARRIVTHSLTHHGSTSVTNVSYTLVEVHTIFGPVNPILISEICLRHIQTWNLFFYFGVVEYTVRN